MSIRTGKSPASRRSVLLVAAVAAAVAVLVSCESRSFKHEPPPGQGSLIVDNRSNDRLHVYLDGTAVNNVSRRDYEIYDLNPGVYRLVVDERDGHRTWRGDMDVLEGQLTVIELKADYSSDEYQAHIYFEN